MARKAVSSTQTFEKTPIWNTKDIKEGEEIEGIYKGCETFNGKFGVTKKYVVEVDGENWGIYGSASLDRQFALVNPGTKVYVTYKGMTNSKNGRQVKDYLVEIDVAE